MANYLAATIGADEPTDGLTDDQRKDVARNSRRGPDVDANGDASNTMSATVSFDGKVIQTERHTPKQGSSNPTSNRGPIILDRTYQSPISLDKAGPDDLVDLPGYGPVPLEVALSQGLTTRAQLEGRSGTAKPVASRNPTLPPADSLTPEEMVQVLKDAEEAEREATHEDLKLEDTGDAEVETTITEFAENVQPDIAEAAAAEFANTNELSQPFIETIAREMHSDPGTVTAKVNVMRSGLENQALRAVGETIGSPELAQAAVDWMYANKPQEMSNAIHQQITKRQTKGYRELAQGFLEGLDRTHPDAVLQATTPAGVTVRQDERGRIIVSKDGQSYQWASAVRNKIVTLS